jgi:zinc transporter ZupT
MFGIVAGMMVYIVIAHLLPGAHRYDPNDEYATMACGFGMLAMSASLMLFMA